MKIPKRFKWLYAWVYRNFTVKKRVFKVEFETYKPKLFELLHTGGGERCLYLGKKKMIIVKKEETNIECNLDYG